MEESESPSILQVEVTNKCNLNCVMCIRNVWNTKLRDLDLSLYKKIAKESFKNLDKLDLYGIGEPLQNPNFLEMVKIARELLPRDSKIFFSTNGTYLTPKISSKLVKEIGVNSKR